MNQNSNDEIVVSVFALAYNHEKYIREALEGFVRQKTNFMFEVLVHDDASTDNTGAIIREYEKRYPKIIKPIYQNENQYSKGKQIAFDIIRPLARGKYYAVCDCDDYWCDENKLQKQVDFLEQHPDYWACGHNSKVVIMKDGSEHLFCNLGESRELKLKEVVEQWCAHCHASSIVSRKQCEDTWTDWVVNADVAADYKKMVWALTQGKVFYMNFVGSVYRKGTKESFSQEWDNNFEFWKKNKIAGIEFNKKMDEYTNRKYHFVFDNAIKRSKEMIFARTNQIQRVEKEIGYYYIIRNHGCKSAICLFLYLNFPKLYYKLKSVKEKFN